MNKLLVICGPTATGKTSLAIKLAKSAFGGNGEIVSADSQQVYRYMDIGTGKDLPVNSKFETLNPKQITNYKLSACAETSAGRQITNEKIGFYEMDGIKVWLYDVVEPNYRFNVADYVECANLVIKDIWKRGKLPILVGGTGFYIKAVTEGIETLGIKPDWGLRKILGDKDIKILREMLEKLDAKRLERMNESDRNNPRRLIRAIEVARQKYTSEVSPSPFLRKGRDPSTSEVKSFFIGLKAQNKELYERIDKRVEERVVHGTEKEIRQLLGKGYTFENSALGATIGYKEWRTEDRGQRTEKESIIQRWKFDEHGYARRQMTWFKNDPRLHWFDIMESDYQQKIARLVKEWYH